MGVGLLVPITWMDEGTLIVKVDLGGLLFSFIFVLCGENKEKRSFKFFVLLKATLHFSSYRLSILFTPLVFFIVMFA